MAKLRIQSVDVTNCYFQNIHVSDQNLGWVVTTLRDEWQPRGDYGVMWNGLRDSREKAAAGMYFYSLETPEGIRQTREIVLLP